MELDHTSEDSRLRFFDPSLRTRVWLAVLQLVAGVLCVPFVVAQSPTSFEYSSKHLGNEVHLIETAAELEELFERRDLRYRAPTLESYLDGVLARLDAPVPDAYINYRVYVVRDPTPLAFALADGQVYLHTGLLARLQSEDQLAFVLGHEIHHVADHDHISTYRAQRGKHAGALVATAVLGVFVPVGGLVQGADFFAGKAKTRFSPAVEKDADHAGMRMAYAAGYDPREAVRALELMKTEPRLGNVQALGDWTTMAELEDRVVGLRAHVEVLPLVSDDEGDANRHAFKTMMAPLITLSIEDYVDADHPREALALAATLLQRGPEAALFTGQGDALVALGPRAEIAPELTDSEIRRLRKMTRDERLAELLATGEGQANNQLNLDRAVVAYRRALELDDQFVAAYRGLGDALFATANFPRAARNYIRYVRLAPGATDKVIVLGRLREIKAILQQQKVEQQ